MPSLTYHQILSPFEFYLHQVILASFCDHDLVCHDHYENDPDANAWKKFKQVIWNSDTYYTTFNPTTGFENIWQVSYKIQITCHKIVSHDDSLCLNIPYSLCLEAKQKKCIYVYIHTHIHYYTDISTHFKGSINYRSNHKCLLLLWHTHTHNAYKKTAYRNTYCNVSIKPTNKFFKITTI